MVGMYNMYVVRITILIVTLLQMRPVFTQDSYKVECQDQQEVCECNEALPEYHFQFETIELHTFVSYTVTEQAGAVKIQAAAGDDYYLSSTGFNPAL